jgi:cyclophilin family peptidyl-prolyl cis-trans isomerase
MYRVRELVNLRNYKMITASKSYFIMFLFILICLSLSCEKSLSQYDSPPVFDIDLSKDYKAIFHLSDGGTFIADLYETQAPITVNNFIFLAEEGFYDGVTFHRVIPGFMAQTGDPTASGSGDPGYSFENEINPELSHNAPGILSMANTGGVATNGSQFFITFGPVEFLNGFEKDGTYKDCSISGVSCHTVFGKVIEGMDQVNAISPRDPMVASEPGDIINRIKIVSD